MAAVTHLVALAQPVLHFVLPITVSSVASACHHGALHFGVGPLLVLLSSILYWQDPVREIALTLMAS